MSELIKISLAGDGRVVVLTQETIIPAFKYLWDLRYAGNPLDLWPIYERKWHNCSDCNLLDVLIGYHLYHKSKVKPQKMFTRFIASEIMLVEQVINHCLLKRGAFLTNEKENQLQISKFSTASWAQNRKNTLFIIRYGLIFILEYIPKERAFNLPGQSFVTEDKDGKIEQVHYDSIKANPITSCLEIKLCNFWNHSEDRTIALRNFSLKRIFKIKEIIPCNGFKL